MSPTVLTYGDVSLTREDLALLGRRGWFNDQILSFFAEWLTQTVTAKYPGVHIVLLPPPLVFFLTFEQDAADVAKMTASLRLPEARAVLLFVNSSSNVTDTSRAQGEHWSVLLWDAAQRAFTAWDSCDTLNAAAARRVAAKLYPLLTGAAVGGEGGGRRAGAGAGAAAGAGAGAGAGAAGDAASSSCGSSSRGGGGGVSGGGGSVGGDGGGVVVENVARLPQQGNSFDCGPYACAFAYAIVRQLLEGNPGPLDVDAVKADVATGPQTRQSLTAIICDMMDGGDGSGGT